MTISELGSLGEFIGSIIVIVTLIYLAIQSKLNHKLLLSNAFSARAANTAAHTRSMATDGELAEIWLKALNNEELSPVEQLRASRHLVGMIRLIENTFFQHQLGLINQDNSHLLRSHVGMLVRSKFLRAYYEAMKDDISPEFVRLTDSYLSSHGVS